MKPSAWASAAARRTSASVASGRAKAMFSRIVVEKRKLSSNTTPTVRRTESTSSERTSSPSRRTAPLSTS